MTYLGIILIPFGIYCFLFNEKLLIYSIVFSSPFTASSLYNFSSFCLTPVHYFSILFIVRYMFIVMKKKKIVYPSKLLFLFMIIAIISILYNSIVGRKFIVFGIGNGVELTLTKIGIQNITQYIYLLVGFLTYWIFYDYLYNYPEQISKIIKVLLVSALCISLIGIYQLISFVFNLPFDMIFRTSTQISIYDFRVSAVAAEPSYLAAFIAPMIGVAYCYYFKGETKIWRLLLICSCGLISTSTTFLVGFGVFIIILLFVDKALQIQQIGKISFTATIFIGIFNYLINNFPDIKRRIIDNTIDKFKLQNSSGMERFSVSTHMLKKGIENPILGVGFGTGRSQDIYTHIFSTTGITGFLTFFSYIATRIIGLWNIRKIRKYNREINSMLYFLIIFYVCCISIPEMYWIYIWIVYSISDSLILLSKNK